MVAESVQDSTGIRKETKNACESTSSDTAADYQKHGSSQALVDVREPELTHTKARKRSFDDVETTTSPVSSQPVTSSIQEKAGPTHAPSNHAIDCTSGADGARKRLRTSEILPNETKDPDSEAGRSSSTDLSASDGIMEYEATSSATTPSDFDALKSSDPQTGRHKDSSDQSTSFSPQKPLIDDQSFLDLEGQTELSHYSLQYPISPRQNAHAPSNSPGPFQSLSTSNGQNPTSPAEQQSDSHRHQPPQEAPPPIYSKSGQLVSLPNHSSPTQSASDVQQMQPSSFNNSITTSDDSATSSKPIHDGADAIMQLLTEQLKSVQAFYKHQMVKFTAVYEANQRNILESELAKKEQEIQERLNKQFSDTLAAKEKEAKESLRRVQTKAYEDFQKQLEVSETNFQKLYQEKLHCMSEKYAKDYQVRQGKLVEAEKTTQIANQELSQKLAISEAKFDEAVEVHQTEISRLKSESEERLKVKEAELIETRRKEASALSESRALERRLKSNEGELQEVVKKLAEMKEGTERIRQERDSALEGLRRDFDEERRRLEACIAEERRKFEWNAELQEKVEQLEKQVAAKREQESTAETQAKKAGIVIMKYLEEAHVTEDLISESSSLLSTKVELDSLRTTLANERKLLEEEKNVHREQNAKFEQEKVLFEEMKKSATHWIEEVKPSLEMQQAAEKAAWEKEKAGWEQTLKDTIARERKDAELSGYEKAMSDARDHAQNLNESHEKNIAAQNVAIEKEKASLTKLSEKLDKRQKQLESTYAARISEVEKMHAQTVQRMQADDALRVAQLNNHWTKEMERRWVTFTEGTEKEKEKERKERAAIEAEHEAERDLCERELQSYKQRLEYSEKRRQASEKQRLEDQAHAQTQAKTIEDLMDGRNLAALQTYSRAEAKDVLEKLVLPGPSLLDSAVELNGQSSSSDPCHLQ